MAVTLVQLGAALRITDGSTEPLEPIRSILSRYLGVAEALVEQQAASAPEAVQDEAVIRMAGYLYDSPTASPGKGFADAFTNSGAAALLSRWRVLRAVVSEAAQAIADVAGVDVAAVLALISSWAHQGNTDQIPASKLHLAAGGGGGVFNDTAVQALIDTHAAISEVHHRRSSSAGIVNVEDGRLASNSGTVMRIGWSESQTYDEAIFTRDGNHPDDGASVGTIAGVFPPVQPTLPAIPDVAANEKYLHIWVGEIPGNIAQLTFFGSPAHGMSAAEAQTYNTTDGTWWRTNLPLSPGISAYAFSATVVGALIASRTYVDEAIAAIPASTGGGFPSTRTPILSTTATSTSVTTHVLDEAFLPNQLYELALNSFTKYLILSPASGVFRIIMPVPDEVGNDQFEGIFIFIQGSIGSTGLSQFELQESTNQTAPVVINKLT